jgi:hypothetical protein
MTWVHFLALLARNGLVLDGPDRKGEYRAYSGPVQRLHQVRCSNGFVTAGYFNRRPAVWCPGTVFAGPNRYAQWHYGGNVYVLTARGHVRLQDTLRLGTFANVLVVL